VFVDTLGNDTVSIECLFERGLIFLVFNVKIKEMY